MARLGIVEVGPYWPEITIGDNVSFEDEDVFRLRDHGVVVGIIECIDQGIRLELESDGRTHSWKLRPSYAVRRWEVINN